MQEIVTKAIEHSNEYDLFLLFAILMFLNSSIMMPPSEYTCVAAGIAGSLLATSFVTLVLIGSAANLAGTAVWYWLGRVHAVHRRSDPAQSVRSSWIRQTYQAWAPIIYKTCNDRGALGVLLLRLVPVIRSIASYPAGRCGMNLVTFAIGSFAGISIWVTIWVFIGWTLGPRATDHLLVVSLGVGAVSLWLYARAKRFSGVTGL